MFTPRPRSTTVLSYRGLSLRRVAVVIFLVTLALLIGALYVAARAILLTGFAEVERQDTERNVRRATAALDRTLIGMSVKASDWGAWDDTCRFIEDSNDAYVVSNLTTESLENLDIDAILFFNCDQELVHAANITADPSNPAHALDKLVVALQTSPLLVHESPASSRAGILMLADGPILAASRPIVTSENLGPVRGAVVFVRRIRTALLDQLAVQTQLTIDLFQTNDPDLPADCRDALSNMRSASPWVRPRDHDRVAGYSMIWDVFHHPALILRIQTPRDVYQQGLLSMQWLIASIVLVGVAVATATLLLLDRVVISRLEQMSVLVQGIGPVTVAQPLPEKGVNELAVLAASINQMVATISASRDQLAVRAAELKIKTEQLDHSRLAAEAANRAKTEFLANMSHEIRTPMTAVLGYTDLLMDAGLSSAERMQYLRMIDAAGHGLLSVINDILDISKIEAGHLEVERVRTSPATIIADVVSLLFGKAAAKGLSLTAHCDNAVPAQINTDPVRFRQILLNVIGNALKFTDQGSVRVGVRLDRAGDPARNLLVIDVKDTGMGIAPDKLDRLFLPFSQADSSTARRFGGTGLGLCISKRLAEALGGSITVDSTQGRGTVFTITVDAGELDSPAWVNEILPSTLAGESAPAAGTPSVAPVQHTIDGRILLADDCIDNRRLLAHILQAAGATVDVVDNGAEAVDAVARATANDRPYNLIVLDMNMPVMDGYTAARRLRTSGVATPIVALTAFALMGEREKCLAAGCDDYATKPINRRELVRVCAMWAARGARTPHPLPTAV